MRDPVRNLAELVIERIYAAATGEVAWSDALAAIAHAHGGDQAALFTPEVPAEAGGLWISRRLPAGVGAGPFDGVVAGAAWFAADTGRSFSFVVEDGTASTVPATVFALHRHPTRPPFDADERAALAAMCRHLVRAMRVWFQARNADRGARVLAASLNAAVAMVDAEGRLLWANRRAEEWVRQGRLVVADRRLVEAPGFTANLGQMVRRAAGGLALLTLSSANGATVELMPVAPPQAGDPDEPGAMAVLVAFRSHAVQAAEGLAAGFGLTPAEAELAIALWNGADLAEFAARRGVGITTVRTQLKGLFAKTGCRRQSDIVSLVARLQPLLAGAPSRITGHCVRPRGLPGRADHPNGG